jgi:hypothetical protein
MPDRPAVEPGIRKTQWLRLTGKGESHRPRAFGGLRRRRNELEYPLYPTEQANAAEAAETLTTAVEIIEAAAKLLPNLGFFSPKVRLVFSARTGPGTETRSLKLDASVEPSNQPSGIWRFAATPGWSCGQVGGVG